MRITRTDTQIFGSDKRSLPAVGFARLLTLIAAAARLLLLVALSPSAGAAPSDEAVAPSGYRLPWPAGQTATVTQIDNPDTDHLSQVDFLLGPETNGDVVAAKPGTVVFVKQASNTSCQFPPKFSECWRKANAIVIQHGPSEYSWYVHIAQGSATVSVGQHVDYGTRIARQGATGYTCGNADCSTPGAHLHFMVSSHHDLGSHCDDNGCWPDQNDPNDIPWAVGIMAVDFDEVGWSDLRAGQVYTSQNRPGGGTASLLWSAVARLREVSGY